MKVMALDLLVYDRFWCPESTVNGEPNVRKVSPDRSLFLK